MAITQEFDYEVGRDMDKVQDLVTGFAADLFMSSPVDTGHFKASWSTEKKGNLSWTIENNAEYASILWLGRRYAGNQYYGSLQWQQGGEPMLERLKYDLERV